MKTGKIWIPTKEKLQILLDSCDNIVQVLKILDLSPHSGNHRSLHKRIKEEGLSTQKLDINRRAFLTQHLNNVRKQKNENVFVEHSSMCTKNIKNKILKGKLISYECAKCKNNGVWNNTRLVLQLDHKNGVNDDNRIENLQFLCPNCHSQTKTFSGRNAKKTQKSKYKICPSCNENRIYKTAKECIKCSHIKQYKFNVSKEELTNLLQNNSYVAIGKMFNVSDVAIKKRAIKFGII